MGISIVVLTFNSQDTLVNTLESARQVSDDIHVVDSFSSDGTLEIARSAGAHIVQRSFENYGAQRNWAIENLPLRHDWQLHLDADERLSPALIDELNTLKGAFPESLAGYHIPRLVHFMGRPIRHGGMFPIWHARLFRRAKGRCERRRYDQHFEIDGPLGKLNGVMIDDIRMSLTEWITRHNRWSDAEVGELLAAEEGGRIRGNWRGHAIEKKRFLKERYYALPLFIRPFLFFFYRYICRLGFLDGKEGLIFFVLQTFWFRFMIDAKLHERRRLTTETPDASVSLNA